MRNTDRLISLLFKTGLLAVLGALILVALTGCEARKFTATRPDGTVITYERVTAIGDSQSEGVSVSKDGDDLTVDVGATGSQAKAEVLLGVLEALK